MGALEASNDSGARRRVGQLSGTFTLFGPRRSHNGLGSKVHVKQHVRTRLVPQETPGQVSNPVGIPYNMKPGMDGKQLVI